MAVDTALTECDLGTVGICILIKGCFSEVVKSLDNFFPNSLTLGSIGRLYTDMGCIFWGLALLWGGQDFRPKEGLHWGGGRKHSEYSRTGLALVLSRIMWPVELTRVLQMRPRFCGLFPSS